MASELGTPRPADLTASLVARLRAGDANAGALLDDLCRKPLLRFCRGYLESAADADDAVQETFCKALTADVIPHNFRAWLYKIARHHCIDVMRRRNRHGEERALPPRSWVAESRTGDLSRLVQWEQRSRMMHLVQALPPEQREVLCLRYGEGLSRSDIAYILEIPESVVKSRIFEGLEALRQHTSLLDQH